MPNRPLIAVLGVVATIGVLAAAIDVQADATADGAFRVSPIAASREDRRAVVRGSTEFALGVYGRLRSRPGNVVFSPVSLATALAMTAEGAAGRTRAEIVSALHVPMARTNRTRAFQSVLAELLPDDGGGVRIEVANALWSDDSLRLRPPFVRRLERSFGASAKQIEFGDREKAAQTINDWADDATHGLISRVISPGDFPNEKGFVLANAAWFQGAWAHPFEARTDGVFSAPDGPVAVPLMNVTMSAPAAFLDEVKLAELPYAGGEYAMLVVLPAPQSSLGELEAGLTSESLASWVAALDDDYLDVEFPAFEFASSLDLSGDVQALGVREAFGKRANFSRMAKPGLRLAFVRQNASVRVDEEGTVAAAVTTVGGSYGQAVSTEPRRFRVDRPFLFLIRHRPTGTLLFLGRVEDPTK